MSSPRRDSVHPANTLAKGRRRTPFAHEPFALGFGPVEQRVVTEERGVKSLERRENLA